MAPLSTRHVPWWLKATLLSLAGSVLLALFYATERPTEARGNAPMAEAANRLGDIGTTAAGSYLAERFALKRRDFEAAARFAEQALRMDPAMPGLRGEALLLFIANDQWSKAAEMARRIVRDQPRHELARLVLGIAAFRRRDYASAEHHFAKAAISPYAVQAAGAMTAWTWVARGNVHKALKALKVLDSYPSLGGVRLYYQALVLDHAGQAMRAGATYERAWKRWTGSARLALAYGNFLRRQGKSREAIGIYRAFLKNWADDAMVRAALEETKRHPRRKPHPFVTSERDGMAEALYQVAAWQLDRDRLFNALMYAHLALWLKPDMHEARLLLGRLEELGGRLPQALAAYARIPRQSPLYPTARLLLAQVQYRLGKPDRAIAVLRALVKRQPENFRAWIVLGDMLRGQKRWTQAEEAYTRAIRLVERQGMRRWQLYYNRGIVRERAGKWKLAEKDLRTALKLDPNQPSVLNYLGYSLIDRGERLQEGLRLVRRALQLSPLDAYIIDSLGWAYFRLGRYQDAVRELERAVYHLDDAAAANPRPDDPVINDHLGDAYWMVGRRLEARYQWRHALDNDPDPELARKIRRKLEHGLTRTVMPKTAEPQGSAPVASAREKPRG